MEDLLENDIITLKGQVEYLAGLINSLNARVKYLENMEEHYKEYHSEKYKNIKECLHYLNAKIQKDKEK